MNDQQRAAMQGALLALEDAYRRDEHSAARWVYSEAMDDLREALAQPQENTARCGGCSKTAKDGWALYCVECWEKAQPQGKWVDLTKAEIWDIREPGYLSFADALIAKFKEKNTPKIVPQGEPVELPCCGYTKPEAIKWNQFNGVVQCHNCGQVYNITPPSVEAAIEATKEKAAKVCESLFDINIHDWDVIEGASMCASAIRSMK